jgi:hypothetical protein
VLGARTFALLVALQCSEGIIEQREIVLATEIEMSTLNTKNNMFGMAGILDSEKINPRANERLFIDPDTRADACNARIKQLKQR